MKVICDNCRAVYKIPDEKLAKPVNKATCRKCGHRMLIPRPRQGQNPDEKTLVTAVPPTPPPAPSREALPERHTNPIAEDEPEATMPGLPPAAYGGGGATGVHQPYNLSSRPSPTLSPASMPPPSNGRDSYGGNNGYGAPGDDVPLYSATPSPAVERDSRPVNARSMPAPPAPHIQPLSTADARGFGAAPGTPTAISRDVTPPKPPPRSAPPPSRPAARQPTPTPQARYASNNGQPAPNTLGTGGDWKPSEAILASISPGSLSTGDPETKPLPNLPPVSNSAGPQPAPLPRTRGGTPASAPMRNAGTNPSIISVYDPANDLVLAMFGAAGGMVGAFILVLAFLTIPTLPILTLVLVGIGMLLAFIGGMATLLVIITGGRGRRPARPLVSVGLAVMLGMFVTTAGVGTLVIRDQLLRPREASTIATASGTPRDDGSVLAAAQPIGGPEVEVVPVDTKATTKTSSPPRTSTAPRTSSSSSSGPVAETFTPRNLGASKPPTVASTVYEEEPVRTTSSTEDDDLSFLDEEEPAVRTTATTSTTATAPKPPPKSDVPETVSDTVIDTILRNDVGIKKCFFNHQRATGSLPERVVVNFKISTAGSISGGSVSDAEFKGSDLEACLAKALSAIAMPPSQTGRTVKYPFQLQ